MLTEYALRRQRRRRTTNVVVVSCGSPVAAIHCFRVCHGSNYIRVHSGALWTRARARRPLPVFGDMMHEIGTGLCGGTEFDMIIYYGPKG